MGALTAWLQQGRHCCRYAINVPLFVPMLGTGPESTDKELKIKCNTKLKK